MRTIRAKLYFSFGIFLLMLCGLGGYGWHNLSQMTDEYSHLYNGNVMAGVYLGEAQNSLWKLRYGFPQFMVVDDAGKNKILEDEPKLYAEIDTLLAKYGQGNRTKDETTALNQLQESFKLYREARPKWFELFRAGKLEEAADWRAKTTTPYGAATVKGFATLINMQQKIGATKQKTVLAEAAVSKTILLCSFLLAFSLGLVISIRLGSKISGAIAEASTNLAIISQGDFTVRSHIRSNDELGTLSKTMNLMAERLGILVGNVSKSSTELIQIGNQVEEISNDVMESAQNQVMAVTESETAVKGILASSETLKGKLDTLAIVSEEIASALSQMVATSEEVAQSIDIQAREVDFVSSSILEMATSIGQTNEHIASLVEDSMTTASSIAHMDDEIKAVEKNAIGTAIETDKALKDAEMGEATVEATVASMVEIRAISHETAEKVSELSDKVAAIDSILKVIDEVSEQTNLLALNAAIIAAQAGEHGKGFAVVADEIKELAARTVVSTSEIAAVIQTIQKETKSVVESIFTVTHRIDDGVSLSRKSGEALSQIVTSVGKALLQVNEIAKSTTEHAAESKRIKGAIERITNMVEHVATASAEQARGAKQISVAAEQMQSLTTHVRTASVEQAATSENITSRTFENVRMIDDIRELSTKNDAMARKVAEEATIINLAAQHNLEGTTGLNQAMNSLIAQSKNLKTELGKFK